MAVTQAHGSRQLSGGHVDGVMAPMPPGLRIRLATEADAHAIGVLVRRATRQDVMPDQSAQAGAHLLRGMTARAERQRIREGKRYFVAELGGRIVGVVATRDDSHVFRLFVSRRWRHVRQSLSRSRARREEAVAVFGPGPQARRIARPGFAERLAADQLVAQRISLRLSGPA